MNRYRFSAIDEIAKMKARLIDMSEFKVEAESKLKAIHAFCSKDICGSYTMRVSYGQDSYDSISRILGDVVIPENDDEPRIVKFVPYKRVPSTKPGMEKRYNVDIEMISGKKHPTWRAKNVLFIAYDKAGNEVCRARYLYDLGDQLSEIYDSVDEAIEIKVAKNLEGK